VVAELNDHGHAETLRMLTDGRIATVEADDVITQVTAQACHQNGLAGVFRNLLDFGGDEIYFNRAPELTGHTYREAVRAFEHACVIGLFRRGQVLLNPAADFVFADGDEVIAIDAHNDRVAFTGFLDDLAVERVTGVEAKEPPQRIALIGWSALGVAVLRELDRFVSAGSVVDLLVVRSVFAPEEIALPEYTHCAVNLHPIDAGPKALLDVLGRNRYDLAIVLGYRRTMTASEADAQSMLTLLALSRAFDSDAARPRVVAEMLDHSNVEIAQTTGVDDFIVSDELSSLMMAQLSERLDLQAVFTELFAPDGCFVSLHPAVLYAPDHETTFASIVASAAERGATALGYRVGRAPAVLNPRKSARIRLGAGDQVLVLAPRESRPLVPAPELERRPAPA
jgi:hypothetical protein